MRTTFLEKSRRPLVSKLAVVVAATVIAGVMSPSSATADELRLGGTGAALANIQRLAETFAATRPELTVKAVPSLGSSGGIKALLAGALDVSVSARRLKDEERSAGATAAEYARSPLVFATSGMAAGGFSRAELVRIYAGETTAWPDGTAMRMVLRPKTESDIQILRDISEDMSRAIDTAFARPGVIEAQTDQDNAEALEVIPGSIGTSTLGQIVAERRALQVLTLDGIEPTPAAAAAGRYPLIKAFYMVVRNDAPPVVREFAAFVLSPAARPILQQQGFWAQGPQPGH